MVKSAARPGRSYSAIVCQPRMSEVTLPSDGAGMRARVDRRRVSFTDHFAKFGSKCGVRSADCASRASCWSKNFGVWIGVKGGMIGVCEPRLCH